MRSPSRLYGIYNEMERMHRTGVPDMRVGQMLSVFNDWLGSQDKDIFYVEDEDFIKIFEQFMNFLKGGTKKND